MSYTIKKTEASCIPVCMNRLMTGVRRSSSSYVMVKRWIEPTKQFQARHHFAQLIAVMTLFRE